MSVSQPPSNRDEAVIRGFGQEWAAFDQTQLSSAEYDELFERYFGIFPWADLPHEAEGFDLGCGSGRWAVRVASRVGRLHCIDPSHQALEVAARRLAPFPNVDLHARSVDSIPLADASQDFGYSLGVLHHVPDTMAALQACVRKLKPGAPFLLYLYYRFDQRPGWFIALWKGSDGIRQLISRAPFRVRKAITDWLALTVYWPLARGALLIEKTGVDVSGLPLSAYRKLSFYSMRTDSLDRFGTRLEQRFSRDEIYSMMERAGLTDIRFSEREPFWVACGKRSASA
jgi:ubiquinone/menaquinone biosynthesis C-methylase UbiE